MFKNFFQTKIFTLLAIVVIGFFVFSIMKMMPTLIAIQKESKNLDQKIEEANNTKSELERLGEYLKSDSYMERQARIKLNFKKPDENVVLIYKNPYNQEKTELSSKKSFWQKIGDWFGNLVK